MTTQLSTNNRRVAPASFPPHNESGPRIAVASQPPVGLLESCPPPPGSDVMAVMREKLSGLWNRAREALTGWVVPSCDVAADESADARLERLSYQWLGCSAAEAYNRLDAGELGDSVVASTLRHYRFLRSLDDGQRIR